MSRSAASQKLEHGPVFSWHTTYNGLLFTSGHAAVDVDNLSLDPGDFAHEVRLTLQNLQRTLHKAGSSLDNVLKVTAYLLDMSYYPLFNEIYAGFFPGDNPPVRTCVEVSRLPYNFKVEVDAIAHL